jgi:hypothetical protein
MQSKEEILASTNELLNYIENLKPIIMNFVYDDAIRNRFTYLESFILQFRNYLCDDLIEQQNVLNKLNRYYDWFNRILVSCVMPTS